MFAHIPSLQLVTDLIDSNKGGAKGHALVRGPWAGLMEHLERYFGPNYSLKIPGRDGSECPFSVNICCWVSSTRLLTLSVLAGVGLGKRGRLVE